jgi:serine/threonine protein kinase
MAPEIVARRDYGKPADMWSIGIVLFVLLSGRMPFPGRPEEVFHQIATGQYSVRANQQNIIEEIVLFRKFNFERLIRYNISL